ncbi:Acetylornithine aminotransferase [Candidatus Ornithobacterium hominis]|uniref:aspartate aminotransferase family protein n=1 Tax=Candidatus Ornithobacterium hominis TaxID=2497989 RepID=UPI000E5AFA36|nr:aspartate aminotransferase family protein [Candidatus Ornithobacterium hominis]SZD73326.1 Acetylornithine aminotransferase [Candidatus Ornithobacterium hominis]
MLKKDFYKYQAQTTPFSSGFEVDYAKGSYIYGKNGKKYLDFVAGVSANTLGHSHPAVIEKITEQLQKHMHVMVYGEYAQEMPVKVCKKLAEILPAPLEVTYLVNSGAEAIDGALKLAKRVTGRSKIVSAKNSYHGNTHGALSVSGNESFKQAFRPLLPDVHFIEFNNFEGLEKIDKHTAAVILESIQGAAGFISSQNQWLKKVREKCDETGTLLILDEIQPGFGRTGKWFAFMHEEIVPDILCMGKGMASGLPIGAFTASTAHMKTLEKNPKLGHITTFGGNPVIAAAALATLEQVEELNLMSEISEKESLFRELLIHPKIKSFRGRGLMIGLELESEVLVQKVAAKAMEKGLILFWLLYETHILRITPPLTISLEEIREGCEILLNCLEEV